jgi:hypothetical protein
MAANYPAMQNTGNLSKYVKEIPSRGVPDKITQEHLVSVGFKSKNDRAIVPTLKFLKIIDTSGVPTQDYKQLRNRGEFRQTLGRLVRENYSSLFQVYPDAYIKDVNTLKDFFATHTSGGEATLRNIVQTFQALCELSEFGGASDNSSHSTNKELPALKAETKEAVTVRSNFTGTSNADIHFNIQVHIPGDQKPEVYETIFKNLGKYVLGINHEE